MREQAETKIPESAELAKLGNLFDDRMIEHVEAWIEASDGPAAEREEKRFRAEFVQVHGHWPLWDLKD
jgi:hypothetical protein